MIIINSTDIFKQLVINYLINSEDLQNEIKSFLFYDIKYAETKRNKRFLINQFNIGINYKQNIRNIWSSWTLTYRYEIILQAVNCNCCGQFHIANGKDINEIPDSMICNCNFEYIHELMKYIFIRTEQSLEYTP